MAVSKLSQIANAPGAPALTDKVIGVGGGTTDYQYTVAQLGAGIGAITQLTGDVTAGPGAGSQVATFREGLALSRVRLAPWDDFDATDGTAMIGRVMPSGQTWGMTGAGAGTAQISKQGYVNTVNGTNSYAFVSDTQNITEIECVTSWTLVSGQIDTNGTSGVIAFTSDAASPISGTSKLLHLQFHPDGWNLLKSLTGPAGLVPPANPPVELNGVPTTPGSWYGGFLKVDTTRYKIRMVGNASANTLTIYFPDGSVLQWTDPDIGTVLAASQTAFWEHDGNGSAGHADLRFHGCAIGPSKAGSVIEACSNKDTALNRSVFASTADWSGQLPFPQPIVKTTNGWYTIAQQSADTPVPKMGGTVTVFGKDASSVHCLFDMVVGAEVPSSGVPTTQNIFTATPELGAWAAGIVDQVRLSANSGSGLINLDIHINNSAAVTLYAQYRGMFAPVVGPVVGATALTSWSQVLTLAFASQTAPQQWNSSDKANTMNITGQNLVCTANASAEAQVRSTTSHSVGRFYAELTANTKAGAAESFGFGLASASHLLTAYTGSDLKSVGYWDDGSIILNGAKILAVNSNTQYATGQTIGIAVDLINYAIYVKNITAGGNWNNNGAANPATGTGGISFSTIQLAPFFLICDIETNGDQGTLNAGNAAFVGTLPAGGHVAWG